MLSRGLTFIFATLLSSAALAQAPLCSDGPTPTCHNRWQALTLRRMDTLNSWSPTQLETYRETRLQTCIDGWLTASGRAAYLAALDALTCPQLNEWLKDSTDSPLGTGHEESSLWWTMLAIPSTNFPGITFAQEMEGMCDGIYCCLIGTGDGLGVPSGVYPDVQSIHHPLGALVLEIREKCGVFVDSEPFTPGTTYDQDGDGIPNATDLSPYAYGSPFIENELCLTQQQIGSICSTELDERDSGLEPGISDWAECGDCTGDGLLTASDLTCINATIFNGPLFGDLVRVDANNSQTVTVSDQVAVNNRIFNPAKGTTCIFNRRCPSNQQGCGE